MASMSVSSARSNIAWLGDPDCKQVPSERQQVAGVLSWRHLRRAESHVPLGTTDGGRFLLQLRSSRTTSCV